MPTQAPRASYHHGDLKQTLVTEGIALVEAEGVRALSLKALAERCGVSAPALYHHFRNKDELLEALGLHALARFEEALAPALYDTASALSFQAFARAYLGFAHEHPALYDLVFGPTTWKGNGDEVRRRAKRSFRAFVRRIDAERERGRPIGKEDPLRLAQVAWATLHGLCRMRDDGLAFSRAAVDDVAIYAAHLLDRALASTSHEG